MEEFLGREDTVSGSMGARVKATHPLMAAIELGEVVEEVACDDGVEAVVTRILGHVVGELVELQFLL